ncbi:MAG: Head fiber protein [Clostridia bacterium]|nr:Head fiber protein [Clostridia bacterium]
MPDTHVTRNFSAHGGNEWVIGGKLTFLEGAEVEGFPGIFTLPYIADSEATSVAALKESFNSLLVALRTAGLMAAEAETEPVSESEPGEGS